MKPTFVIFRHLEVSCTQFFIGLFLFFICQFSIVNVVFSQQPAYFILGEKEFEGVQIYDVIQDNENNYWFATDQGFFKYDNYTFEQISCKNMKGTSAFGFVKNQKGIIYCYNLNKQILKIETGICSVFYEMTNDEVAHEVQLQITAKDELMVITRTAFILDAHGKKKNISSPHFSYYGFPFLLPDGRIISNMASKDSILVYDGSKFSHQKIYWDIKPGLGVLKFFSMNDSIYAITTGTKNIYSYNYEKNELVFLRKYNDLVETEFFRFYEVDDKLWIAGSLSGAYLFNQGGNSFLLKGRYYPEYLISDVFKDAEGNILLSTFNHGVLVIPDFKIPDVLPLDGVEAVASISTDGNFGLMLGTMKGDLIGFPEGDKTVLNTNGSHPVHTIFNFREFPYIIFDDGKIKALQRETFQEVILKEASLKDAVFYDPNTIYIAQNKGIGKIHLVEGVLTYTLLELGSELRLYSIEKDDQGNIYIATSDGFKKMIDEKEIQAIKYKGEDVFVNDVFSSGDSVYAATKSMGILILKNGSVCGQILPSWKNKPFEILKLEKEDDLFYLLTSKGFFVMNGKGQLLTHLNKVHGFSTQRIFDFEVHGRTIWIAHSNGVHRISVDNLFYGVDIPKIILNTFSVNGHKIIPKEVNEFEYTSRDFHFIFSSPTLKNKENIRYHFMLEGYDSEWQVSDYFSNEVSYNALAPGLYTFRVKAENQGVFSKEIIISIKINGPFYYSWWFILLVTGSIVGGVIIFYRRKLRNQKRKAEVVNEMNASRLAAIQSQMNPHFIFNSMNAIQDLVLKGDIDNSYTFITKFSDLVRRTLDYSGKDFIEIEQELKLIELYLSLEKLRFKDQLVISFDANGMEDILVPPMLIQPFIENSILHGLLHKEGEKKIVISFSLEDCLICTIEDNGIGRKASQEIKLRQRAEHESFSGKAIKKRFEILKDIFGTDLGFEYIDLEKDGQPVGTKVVLKIPVKRKF